MLEHSISKWVCSILALMMVLNNLALALIKSHNIKPSIATRTLQFYVKDEPGALANALKAFRVSDCSKDSNS